MGGVEERHAVVFSEANESAYVRGGLMNDVFIGEGNMVGHGVYSNRKFKKGEIVIQYDLKPLTEEEYKGLLESEKMFVHSHRGKLYLYSEPERYVNHSKRPNTFQDITNRCDVALVDIQKGEMVTCDATKDDVC